jgi:hypothetical protein
MFRSVLLAAASLNSSAIWPDPILSTSLQSTVVYVDELRETQLQAIPPGIAPGSTHNTTSGYSWEFSAKKLLFLSQIIFILSSCWNLDVRLAKMLASDEPAVKELGMPPLQ